MTVGRANGFTARNACDTVRAWVMNCQLTSVRWRGGFELRLKVVPGSSRTMIAGALGDRLKVKVAAPPEGGRANKEVLDVIRRWTKVRDVELVAGQTHPEKTVRVRGVAAGFEWGSVK